MDILNRVSKDTIDAVISYTVYMIDGGLNDELIFDSLMDILAPLKDCHNDPFTTDDISELARAIMVEANRILC